MDAKALATLLDGREYREEITEDEEAKAKASGLVVVFGASDDLMEFRGAVNDEIGSYDGGTAYLNNKGLLENECDNEDCPHFERLKAKAATIEADWCPPEGGSWAFRTTIPHETFMIYEEGELYCTGIVFALADVPTN